jgi:hypothetical protein
MVYVDIARTDCPGRMNRDAISLQKERILYDTHRTPMKANALVVGAAHGSIGFRVSMFVMLDIVQRFDHNRQLLVEGEIHLGEEHKPRRGGAIVSVHT